MNDYDEIAYSNQSTRYFYHYFYDKLNDYLESYYGSSVKEVYFIVVDSISRFNEDFLNFDEFQLKILKVILTVLLINVALVIVLWYVYKDRIYERFIQPASTSLIEELRKSVSQLKLPRGHSPRI